MVARKAHNIYARFDSGIRNKQKIITMKKLILSLFLAIILPSCVKTIETIKEIPVEVTKYVQRSDTLIINTTDSIYIRQKGDTVFSERFKTVFRDRIRVERDSIPYIVEITKTDVRVEERIVEKNKIGFTDYIGFSAIVFLLVKIVLFIRKKLLHL